MSDSDITPDMRAALSRHVLSEYVRVPCVDGSQGEDVRFFRMAEPGTRMMSVDLFFGAGRIWISGDLRITEDRGVVSDLGYGLAWFAGKLGEDYLAQKFLRKRHVPALAVAEVKEDAARFFEDRFVGGEEPDEGAKQLKAALEEAAAQGEDGLCGLARELFDFYSDLEIDTSNGVPGWGYDPREVGWLATIQQRFAELYAVHEQTRRYEPRTFDASGGREGE